MRNEEILNELSTLDDRFDVHTIDSGWYTPHALLSCVGSKLAAEYPEVKTVRVRLPDGMLELHSYQDQVEIKCYCCFDGNPDHGIVSLKELKNKVEFLVDHKCPPWPG